MHRIGTYKKNVFRKLHKTFGKKKTNNINCFSFRPIKNTYVPLTGSYTRVGWSLGESDDNGEFEAHTKQDRFKKKKIEKKFNLIISNKNHLCFFNCV